MTSREHARRLMLILLSSDGGPDARHAAAGGERGHDVGASGRGDDAATRAGAGGTAVVAQLTGT
jgi:hypothetical protein